MALAKKPITLKNPVNPLAWNVPMVNPNGTPTEEFQRKWLQQAGANSSIVNVTTAAGVSAVLDILSSVVGSLLVRGTSAWQGLGPAGNGRVLRDHGAGATPTWDTLSTILDLFSSTQGAVLYRDAAAWNALAPGGAGQVLTSGGPAANPAWSTSASGGGAASIQDDGTTVFIALSDTDGQLVLDGSGDPIFSPEVFSVAAIPQLGLAQMPPSTVIPCFSAQATANQIFAASSVAEKINITNEIFDTTNNFATSRFTAAVAGYYQIDAKFLGDDTVSVSSVIGWLYKNGAAYSEFIGSQFAGGGGGQTGILAEVVHLAVGDYVELWGQAAGTAPYSRFVSAQLCSRLSGFLIVKD